MPINERKAIRIVALLLMLVLSSQLKGQTIKVASFDGKEQLITVKHDSNRDILTIATLQDTVHIKDCTVVEKVSALNKYFAKITYRVRGGSGIHIRHMIVLTSRGGRLCQSLHITSLFEEYYIDYSKNPASATPNGSSLYEVSIKAINDGNQKMILSVRTMKNSRYNPSDNYSRRESIILSFDTTRNIFYNRSINVSQHFSVHDPGTRQESIQYLNEIFSCIELLEYSYYHVKGEWYEMSASKNLLKYYYR